MLETKLKLHALGCHIFAGGFSIGVEKHFALLGHLERTSYAVASWQRYRPLVPVYVDKAAQWGDAVREHRGRVDWLYANPPCAPWSVSSVGYRRGLDSSLLDWTRDVVRVGADVGARVVAIESVRGALKNGAHFYDALWREHRSVWGGMMWVLVNAVDHGLPQDRARLFVVLAPEVFKVIRSTTPATTILDAIAGAPADVPISSKSIYSPGHGVNPDDIVACVPLLEPGQRMSSVSPTVLSAVSPQLAESMAGVKFTAHLPYKLRADAPCPVVYGLPRYVHPTEPRLLTLRELMRVTGYPDDFEFVGADQGTACRQLGKTVCPPVGEWLAREVAAYLRGERAERGGGQVVLDCASRGGQQQLTIEDL